MPQTDVCADAPLEGYAFAYLDETTKRMIRRGLLKAVAIPGYQVPFASREMPMPCGWGTGGIQVTASILGRDDVLKVIDQGSDDTTNAVSIRDFFRKTTGVATTTHTDEATIIQTRHRIPEQPLRADQILVLDKGRIIQRGRHEELMEQGGLYADFIRIREQAVGWSL